MKRRDLLKMLPLAAAPYAGLQVLRAQQAKIEDTITRREGLSIAVPDFRGRGVSPELMNAFNATVWGDLQDSGALTLISKSFYPLETPESLGDVKVGEWHGAPVLAQYLGIGYAQVMGGNMIELRGTFLNLEVDNAQQGSLFNNRPYFGDLNEAGAQKVGHEYAADILRQLGVQSLAGSKIYFISDRSGNKEVWSMDYDGQNQRRMTNDRLIAAAVTVSSDGKLAAYAVKEPLRWSLRMFDATTGRSRAFNNPSTSLISAPDFAPGNQKLWFSMVDGGWQQVEYSNVDGSGRQRVSNVKAIETAPRVNPKTGSEVLFISGRGGTPQLYKMNADGTGVVRITDGTGEAANPAWSPDGLKMTFCWTRGYERGGFNIFIADANGGNLVQLTHGSGANENPSWAPDGLHLVFSNKRGPYTQIYTMLANGTRVKQLTSQGDNSQPVWATKIS